MPLPLAPLAGLALRYGAVALAAYALTRARSPGRTDQRAEDALDDLAEGVALHRPADRPGQHSAQARFRRVIRLGADGPGVELDAAAIGRLRFRKV
ncbi:hypothetical protein ABIE69_000696 [Rhodobacteraceae bacterium MBR-64]|jgi:hypothetical protein